MITDPAMFIPRFAESGADYITVHLESGPHLHRNIQSKKSSISKPASVLIRTLR
jgi:ribulose-phosphate 3-epimerase